MSQFWRLAGVWLGLGVLAAGIGVAGYAGWRLSQPFVPAQPHPLPSAPVHLAETQGG